MAKRQKLIPIYRGKRYSKATPSAKRAVMKRANQLRKYMESRLALRKAWNDVIKRS